VRHPNPKHPQSKHHENQKFTDAVQKVNIRNNPAENSICSPAFREPDSNNHKINDNQFL
jgi:hypothetical protein